MGDFNRGRSEGRFKKRDYNDRGYGNRSFDRPEMHKAVCDKCRNECEVPFRPTSGKPIFCSSCFENNRSDSDPARSGFRRSGDRNFEERRMFSAVCDECKNSCQVPFQPRGDKPIYCSNCFETKGGRSPETAKVSYESQFEALNSKLDKILGILTPAAKEVAKIEETIEEKVKAPKKSAPKKKSPSKE